MILPSRHPGSRVTAPIAAMTLLLVLFTGCRRRDFPEYPANYREYAYITNGASDTVSVIDVVHLRIDREIQVGIHPVALAVSPSRNEVYILNSGVRPSATATDREPPFGSVSILDTARQRVVATLPVGREPTAIHLSANGDFAYIANSGSNSVTVLDLALRRTAVVLGVGEKPVQARISPDGASLVVTNSKAGSVSLFNAGEPNHQITQRSVFTGCPGASEIAILPDSSKAFVTCSSGHQVMAIALAQKADPKQNRSPGRPDAIEALLDVGQNPVALALKPDGGELFVSNAASNSISEIVTSSDDVGGAYLIGAQPVAGLVSPDNSTLYEANFQSQEVALYAIDDGQRAGSIHVGDGPLALALSASGHLLFAVDQRSGDVAAIRTSTHSLFTLFSVGREPDAIAIKSFRAR